MEITTRHQLTLCSFFWTMLLSSVLIGQPNLPFRHLTSEDGLHSNYILDLLQDDLGYIWIATPEGLFRYDGQNVQSFPSTPSDSTAMQSEVINALAKDAHGDLWIGSGEGILQRRKKMTGRFEHWELPITESLQVSTIWDVEVAADGKIWMGLERSVACFDPQTALFQSWRPSQHNSKLNPKLHDVVYSVKEDPNQPGHLYLGTRKGLLRFHTAGNVFDWVVPPPSVAMYLSGIWELEFGPDGTLWAPGDGHFTIQYNPATEDWKWWDGNGDSHLAMRTILPVDERHVWMGGRAEGLYLLDPVTGLYSVIKNRADDHLSILPGGMESLLYDRGGNLWCGMDGGLSWAVPRPLFFEHFYLPEVEGASVPNIPTIWSVLEMREDSIILFGTIKRRELALFDLRTNTFLPPVPIPKESENLAHWFIRDIEYGTDGKIYLATKTGFFEYKHQERKIVRPLGLPEFLKKANLLETIRDQKGNFWSITYPYGILRYSPPSQEYRHFSYENDAGRGFPKLEFINDISIDGEGKVWFGGEPSIAAIDPQSERIESFSTGDGMTNTWVKALEAGKDGAIWIGYKYGGLDQFFPAEKRAVHLTASDGLPSNKIYEMVFDESGDLWLATGNGLSRLDTETLDFRNFQERDGLLHDDLHIQWVTTLERLESGRMILGGPGFFTQFFPEQLVRQKWNNQLVFNSLTVFDKEKYFEKDLNFLKEITLPWTENFFTFCFANMNYESSEPPVFRYRLEGLEKDWRITSEGRATYTDVEGGDYLFHVQVADAEGNWEEESELGLGLHIIPPLWKRGWFQGLLGLILALGLWGAYRFRIRQVKVQESLKLAYDRRAMESEMKALRSQMNPHFLFNSLNSIKQYIIQNDIRSSTNYLTKFSRLMRQVLNNSHHSSVSFANEIAALELYIQLEQMRFPNKFSYRIDLPKNANLELIQIPPLLFQPFVENAIWHGFMQSEVPGELVVSATFQAGYLEVLIIDNGIGRERSAALRKSGANTRKSMGMQLSTDRLRLASLRLENDSEVVIEDLKKPDGSAAGTKVKIRIPTQFTYHEN